MKINGEFCTYVWARNYDAIWNGVAVSSRSLEIRSRWNWHSRSRVPAVLTPGKNTCGYLRDVMLCGTQSRPGVRDERNVRWFARNEPVVTQPVINRWIYHNLTVIISTGSTFVTLLSRCAQSGRWSSFGKRGWFTESHVVLIISVLLVVLITQFIIDTK